MQGTVKIAVGFMRIDQVVALRGTLIAFFSLRANGSMAERDRISLQRLSALEKRQPAGRFLDQDVICARGSWQRPQLIVGRDKDQRRQDADQGQDSKDWGAS